MDEIRYYKGFHKVKVLTESEGYWIVEALEDFEDLVNDEKMLVKRGERRIVPIDTLHKRKTFAPMVKEHAYELQMEKKLKRLIKEEETSTKKQKP